MPTVRQKQQTDAQQLDSFGTDSSQLMFEDELSLAENLGGQFITRVKDNIEQADMIVTGRIDDIIIQRTDVGFDILANNYLIYEDAGVNGAELKLYDTPFSYKDRRPPVDVIKEWIIAKGLEGDGDIDSQAFAYAEKIYREGLRPKNIFAKEIPKLADDVAQAVGNLVVNTFMRGNENGHG